MSAARDLAFAARSGRLAGAVLAATALGGLAVPAVYARESASWAAQGWGQDWVNLLVVAPTLVLAAQAARDGSRRARPMLGGALAYTAYAAAVSAFSLRFNPLFPAYCAQLGLASFGLVRLASLLAREPPRSWYERPPAVAFPALLLIATALTFGALWSLEIAGALVAGTDPPSTRDAGLAANPVHVLDLALVLPAMFVVGRALWRRQHSGFALGPVLLVFTALMALAIVGMMVSMRLRGVAVVDPVVPAAIGLVGFGALAALVSLLRGLRDPFPRSTRLDHWLPAAPFRDRIAIRSSAPADRLLQAFEQVTAAEMPLAYLLGWLRYLPARLAGGAAAERASVGLSEPFVPSLVSRSGNVILERADGELVLGVAGKLHQIVDQAIVLLATPDAFRAFTAPEHQRLAMSLRAIADRGGSWLVLEHRTQPTDAAAHRRWARYWRVIRPTGALVTAQLLRATARRAERAVRADRLSRLRSIERLRAQRRPPTTPALRSPSPLEQPPAKPAR